MTLAPRPGDEADANDGLVLVYDAWNRLTEVYDDNDGDGEADAGELIVTCEYDGQRRLVTKTVEGDPDVIYDNYYNSDWQLLELRRTDDADPQDQYVWDLRYLDAPAARFHDANTDGDYDDAEDNVLYYTTDAKFNVTAVVNTSGNVAERYAYDPYGQVTVLNGADGTDPDVDGETVFEWDPDADALSDVDNRVLYAGYHFDSETGLYIVRNRMYHPTLGRWLQRDSIQDGMNLYEYVGCNPIVLSDPYGVAPTSAPTTAPATAPALPTRDPWVIKWNVETVTPHLKKTPKGREALWILRCGDWKVYYQERVYWYTTYYTDASKTKPTGKTKTTSIDASVDKTHLRINVSPTLSPPQAALALIHETSHVKQLQPALDDAMRKERADPRNRGLNRQMLLWKAAARMALTERHDTRETELEAWTAQEEAAFAMKLPPTRKSFVKLVHGIRTLDKSAIRAYIDELYGPKKVPPDEMYFKTIKIPEGKPRCAGALKW